MAQLRSCYHSFLDISLKILHKYNIELKGKIFDTIIAHYIINPDRKHDIEIITNDINCIIGISY